MDSSRGSRLTNLMMMLPMVVVPTLALLQMPENKGSLLSKLVSAATGGSDAPPANEDPITASADDFWAELESSATTSAPENADTAEAVFSEDLAEPAPFGDDLASPFEESSFPPAESAPFGSAEPGNKVQSGPEMAAVVVSETPRLAGLLNQIQSLGATRTMWFGPGGQQFGFIAFVNAGQQTVSYRFESIAASPEAAVADVLIKIQRWRQQSQP